MGELSDQHRLQMKLLERAQRDRDFVGSAFAWWRKVHPDQDVSQFLGCESDDLWRLALVRRPRHLAEFALAAKEVERSFHVDAAAFLALLRLADSLDALRTSGAQSEE